MDLNEKIKKTTEDIERLQEKLNNKKKELAMLESKKQEQEQRERISRNEKFVSSIEEKIGGNVTDDLLQKIMLQIEKEQEHTHE